MTVETDFAQLAIDPPVIAGRRRLPTPCRILDGALRPLSSVMADGALHEVPSGLIVLIVAAPGGSAQRRVLRLEPGGRYRLHFFPRAAADGPPVQSALADAEAMSTIAYLESGQVMEAWELAARRLPELLNRRMGDPCAAAAVGYVLLQRWEFDKLAPWCFDLPHEHPWLGDGYVIAAEWHAHAGNHVTALNYLHRLRKSDLPVFTIGLSRALERLAAYRALSIEHPPSVRAAREGAGNPRASPAAQLLNRWDIEDAAVAYRELTDRTAHVALEAVTIVKEEETRPTWRFSLVIAAQRAVDWMAMRSAIQTTPKGVTAMGAAEPNEQPKEQRSGITGIPMIVAIGAILVWVVFAIAMLLQAAAAGEITWNRLSFIFASVEAIAFAAAGALFGVTVQAQRVQQAEAKADANARDAANGRALAAINLADEAQVIEQDREGAFERYGPADAKDAEVRRRHAEAARRLFPDL
jgi:hypothetical protein